MGVALLLLLVSGPLLVIALLAASWKYLLAVVVVAVGWHLAERMQVRLKQRSQWRKSD